MNHTHEMASYRARLHGRNAWNGARAYSEEIVRNIIPLVNTSRPWVTVNQRGECEDHAIVFIHNNRHPENYAWLRAYEDLVLVCGVPETCGRVAHLGRAVYLPLSVDVAEISAHRRDKDRGTCFAGRSNKRKGMRLERGTEFVEDLPRVRFLDELARYHRAYAVGRCALEAKVLGCEVLPYDPRFPDPSFWAVVDNAEAAGMLQDLLDGIG